MVDHQAVGRFKVWRNADRFPIQIGRCRLKVGKNERGEMFSCHPHNQSWFDATSATIGIIRQGGTFLNTENKHAMEGLKTHKSWAEPHFPSKSAKFPLDSPFLGCKMDAN